MTRQEYNKNYMRKRREVLQDKNICPVCGKRQKMANYSICNRCYEYQIKYRNKIKEMLNNAR